MTTSGTMQGATVHYLETDFFPSGPVERATLADAADVILLGEAMHHDSVYSFLPFDRSKCTKLFEAAINNPKTMFIGVMRNGSREMVGFFLGYMTPYFFCNEMMAHDLLMYVKPPYRGTAVAIHLVDAFAQWGFARGAREIAVGVSAMADNTKTYSFLEKLGFSEVGREFKIRKA